MRKTGNTISIKFKEEGESIRYPIQKIALATLESDNSFLFDVSNPSEIEIMANGVVICLFAFNLNLGEVNKLRMNEDGVFARKFLTWHTVIDFNAP